MSGPARLDAPFVDVAVNTGTPQRGAFTYARPRGMRVLPGQAVFVPWGPRTVQGIVLRGARQTDLPDIRPIEAVADPEPVLDAHHIELAGWMSQEYLAPLWDCVALCLPPGYGQKPVTMVTAVDVPALLPPGEREQRILTYVAARVSVPLATLAEKVRGATEEDLQRLQARGYLTALRGIARPAVTPKLERRVRLLVSPEEARQEAARMLEAHPARKIAPRILERLAERGQERRSELTKATSADRRRLEELATAGLIEEYEVRVERGVDLGTRSGDPAVPLTAAQAAAVAVIEESAVTLLHGVTGSGKTEVYLECIAHALDRGQGALVLVPEISLTPQAIRRYGERFGGEMAVLHSGLGAGERYDAWFRVQRGEARVVLGSRSAVFAPVQDLGIVIIDEEHEPTYKEEGRAPRYHARRVARWLCKQAGARLVLGSATPDVATYHESESGGIARAELPDRIYRGAGGATETGSAPEVTVVDMRDELAGGNRGMFSKALDGAVRRALDAGEQAILFVNRRGTARFILCRDCGYVAACRTCEMAYSLSRDSEAASRMVCHQCGTMPPLEEACPRCASRRYRPFGVGTQRVEDEAGRVFRGARVARWDMETARRKGAHRELLERVEAHEIDILVGTQMLAKGLDLPAMRVVGVVDADVGLNAPDFRRHERIFQLLAQVGGRAGRRGERGTVVIQTYNPEAPPIQFAAGHDYAGFYVQEREHRRQAGYPPFGRLVRLTYGDRNERRGREVASGYAASLRADLAELGAGEPEVIGPAPASVPRVRGVYRWQLTLRGPDPVAFLREREPGAGWSIDVDPVGS